MEDECCGLNTARRGKLGAISSPGGPFPQNGSLRPLQFDAPGPQQEEVDDTSKRTGDVSPQFDHVHQDLLKYSAGKVVGKPSHLHLDVRDAKRQSVGDQVVDTPYGPSLSGRGRPLSARGVSPRDRPLSARGTTASISKQTIHERLAKVREAHEASREGTLNSLLDWSVPNVDAQSSKESSARHLLSKVIRRLDILEASIESLKHSVQWKELQSNGADVSELHNILAQTGDLTPKMTNANLPVASMHLIISNWKDISNLRDLCQAYESRIMELEDFCENSDNRLSDLESLVETIDGAPVGSGPVASGDAGDLPKDIFTVVQLSQERTSVIHSGSSGLTAKEPEDLTRNTLAGAIPETDVLPQTAKQCIDHLHAKELYRFAQNVWDASLFIGAPQIGLGGSLFMSFLLLMNTAMQLIYMLFVFEYFTQSNFDEETVRGYRRFRLHVAHDSKHVDQDTISLASRLCGNDHALEVAQEQMTALRLINDYMPNEAFKAFRGQSLLGQYPGAVMCVISIVVWICTVVKEIRSIAALVAGILHMHKRSDTTGRIDFHLVDGLWEFQRMSRQRYTVVAVVSALRLAIVLLLGFAGVMYLTFTISLHDLILNSVGLVCVLNVDEMIFESMAPYPVRHFVMSLKPIFTPGLARWRGIDAKAALSLVAAVGTAIATIPVWLVPEMNALKAAREALCNGRRDFVSREGNYPPYMFWAETKPFDKKRNTYLHHYNKQLVRSTQEDATNVRISRLPSPRGGVWSLQDISELSVSQAAMIFNPTCLDVPFDYTPQSLMDMYRDSLREASGKQIKEVCEKSLLILCTAPTEGGRIVRTLCPVLCGCDDPASDQVFLESTYGCPPSCRHTAKYQEALKTYPCQDSAYDQIGMQRYARRVADIAIEGHWPDLVQVQVQNLKTWMLNAGCEAISHHKEKHRSEEICLEGSSKAVPWKSFRIWCPISCNCPNRSQDDRHNCPLTCYR